MNKALILVYRIKKAKDPKKVIKLKRQLKQYCYYSDINYKRLIEYHKI